MWRPRTPSRLATPALSVHKVFFHGPKIAEFLEVTTGTGTGFFSEEPMEALISKIRKIRSENSRFISRKTNNYDTLTNIYIF